MAARYDGDGFRSTVVMSRHGFGRGEYRYFAYPLPGPVSELRAALYPPLAEIANRWNAALGERLRYPAEHSEYLARCHAAGQTRQVMENLTRVLAGCGLELRNVVSVRVFLTHFQDDYEQMNRVYAGYFPAGKRPARTCVGVTGLARGARVEIDMIARRS